MEEDEAPHLQRFAKPGLGFLDWKQISKCLFCRIVMVAFVQIKRPTESISLRSTLWHLSQPLKWDESLNLVCWSATLQVFTIIALYIMIKTYKNNFACFSFFPPFHILKSSTHKQRANFSKKPFLPHHFHRLPNPPKKHSHSGGLPKRSATEDLENATRWVLETAVPLSGELSASPLEDFWKAVRSGFLCWKER